MNRRLGVKATVVLATLLIGASACRADMITIAPTFTHESGDAAMRAAREAVFARAIQDWTGALCTPSGQPVTLTLDVAFRDLGPANGGNTFSIRPDPNGNPGRASIELNIHMDAVNPAQNYYWNVDPAGLDGNRDGLSIARHELGHALGFAGGSTADLLGYDKWNAAIPAGSDMFNLNGVMATMAGTDAGGRSHLSSTAHPGDLMNTSVGAGNRREISGLDVAMLQATFAYQPCPEPSSLLLAGLGALGMLSYAWRRRKQAA
jgi:hypothetical protein